MTTITLRPKRPRVKNHIGASNLVHTLILCLDPYWFSSWLGNFWPSGRQNTWKGVFLELPASEKFARLCLYMLWDISLKLGNILLVNDYFGNIASSIGFEDGITSVEAAIQKHNRLPSVVIIRDNFTELKTFTFCTVSPDDISYKLKSIDNKKVYGNLSWWWLCSKSCAEWKHHSCIRKTRSSPGRNHWFKIKFSLHVSSMCKKAARQLNALARI